MLLPKDLLSFSLHQTEMQNITLGIRESILVSANLSLKENMYFLVSRCFNFQLHFYTIKVFGWLAFFFLVFCCGCCLFVCDIFPLFTSQFLAKITAKDSWCLSQAVTQKFHPKKTQKQQQSQTHTHKKTPQKPHTRHLPCIPKLQS